MHAPEVSLHEPVNEWNGPGTGGNVRDVTGGLSSNVRDVMNMKWRVALVWCVFVDGAGDWNIL